MKKVILIAMVLVAGVSFGQEKETTQKEKSTITVFGNMGHQGAIGFEFETYDVLNTGENESLILKVSRNTLKVEFDNIDDVFSNGKETTIGFRKYYKKNNVAKGFYSSNYITYGTHKFKSTYYNGKYRYFSFVRPELGYRFLAGNFNFDLNLMGMWKIEIKGKDDVDNKTFDNNEYRLGFGVGYTF